MDLARATCYLRCCHIRTGQKTYFYITDDIQSVQIRVEGIDRRYIVTFIIISVQITNVNNLVNVN